MCIPYDGPCDSYSHPFERTLHIGDLIAIQGVDPHALNTNYHNSDIIVFHNPQNLDELIVHRIVRTQEINGTLYFFTKGDGNNAPNVWPNPLTIKDLWRSTDPNIPLEAVNESLIEGKVIMRIPRVGLIAISMREIFGTNTFSIVVPILMVLIILLAIAEFILPSLKKKPKAPSQHIKSEFERPNTRQMYL
jgi:signal peptidase I